MDLFTAAKTVDIVEVYKKYTGTKKVKRGRKYVAVRCIYHEDKHPSLNLDKENNAFYCFQCNRKGTGIDLVMELLKVDNVTAAKTICQDFGVAYDEPRCRTTSKEATEGESKKKTLLSVNGKLAKAFHAHLASAPDPLYFEKRGLGALVEEYQLGYCPKGRLFAEQSIKSAEALGLCDSSGQSVFAGRYVVPIKDARGDVIGFIGRLPDGPNPNELPKYINSCNSEVFRKREVLFNVGCLKGASDKILIVEGVFDALSYIAAGVEGVISPLGCSLSDLHLDILRRFPGKTMVLAFDQDATGIEATKKAIWYSRNIRLNVLTANYRSCKDANELLMKHGPQYLASAVQSISAPEYIIKCFEANKTLDSLEGQEKLWMSLAKVLGCEQRRESYPINVAYTPVAYNHYWGVFDAVIRAHPIN